MSKRHIDNMANALSWARTVIDERMPDHDEYKIWVIDLIDLALRPWITMTEGEAQQ